MQDAREFVSEDLALLQRSSTKIVKKRNCVGDLQADRRHLRFTVSSPATGLLKVGKL